MSQITNATYTSPDWTSYAYPKSLAPLPEQMHTGLIVLCLFAGLSTLATFSLMALISYRLFTGRKDGQSPLYMNQYIILIYNLLFSDLTCAWAFFMSVKWVVNNELRAPSTFCWAQAFFLNLGDLASGFFIFAIALHTMLTVVFSYTLPFRSFCFSIVGLWIAALFLTVMPVILHPADMFVVSGNWCSIGSTYNVLRLYFHYIWVFGAELAVILIYGTTFIILRKRMGGILPHLNKSEGGVKASSHNNKSRRKVSLAALYMILYPVAYIICTLPLAAGRIAGMAGKPPTNEYLLIGGILMSSAGWINCVLYTFTRRILTTTKNDKPTNYAVSRSARTGGGDDTMSSGARDVTKSSKSRDRYQEIESPLGSTEHIVMNQWTAGSDGAVKAETTWEVKTESINDETDPDIRSHHTYCSAK